MRVLHVISSGGMYGAEAVILNLARAMEAGPHSVELGVFENLPHANLQLHESALRQWVPSQLIRCRGQMDWAAVVRIRQLAAETRADVVHAHGFKADIYAYLAMRQSGVPLVSTCHTWYDTDRMVRMYGALDRLVLRRYARVVAVSNEVRQRLLKSGVREDRIRMVRNGIDLRPFAAAKPTLRADFGEATLVGMVARLAREKGIDIFLRAAARVLVEFPEVRFAVAGEGPDRGKLEELIGELGIGKSVTMLGRREDMAGMYASLDVMVSASRQEGLPMAILEGMASGRAMVATAVGEVPKLVVDGKTGVLVAAEDVDALAAGIAGLLREPELRARLGAAAREMVRAEYSAERMAGEYLEVYGEAIAEAKGAGRRPRVFLMDLWATVPYYTAYLAKALMAEGEVDLQVGSIDYYLDPECFSSRGIRVDPGLMNVVGRYPLQRLPRRVLKGAEGMVNLAALAVRFASKRPDVVHVQYLPMLLGRMPLDLWFVEFCQRRGAKIVLTVHDLLPHDTGEAHREAFRDLYARVDGIICHSGSVRARLAEEFGVPNAKVRVIAHGPFFFDLPASGEAERPGRLGLEGAGIVVLWQGIVFAYKGLDVLLRAWREVEARVDGAWLVVAGTGAPELLDEMRGLAEELGLKRVRMEFRFVTAEELVALYRRANVVVYPYRAITTSGALATGLALGKAIIASDLPVFRELLTDGESALLVAPGDVEGLAGALVALAKDAGLRERLAGRVRAMEFGDEAWREIAEQTVAAYRGVLGG